MATAVDRNVSEPEFAAMVAFDWGNDKHAWVTQDVESGTRERGELEARPEHVDAWMTAYLARYPGRQVAVALEQKRGALLYSLMKYQEVVLYPIHGATANSFRRALYPSGSKDDHKDADLLLDLLIQHRDRIRRLDPDTEETRQLQLLVEKRRTLVDERTRQSNRLTAELKMYFPQVLGWFSDAERTQACAVAPGGRFSKPLAYAAGGTACAPGDGAPFAVCGPNGLHQHNCRSKERIEQRLEELRQAVAVTTDQAVEPTVIMVRALVECMASLSKSIKEFEDKIEEVMAVHPEAKLPHRPETGFRSLPAAGPALAQLSQLERLANQNRFVFSTGLPKVCTTFSVEAGALRTGRRCAVKAGLAK